MMVALPSRALAALEFTLEPDIPALGSVTLTGGSQINTAQMPAWEVRDSNLVSFGWHVTGQGDDSSGRSAVFKEYCTDGAATNGCNAAVGGGPGPGYVSGGASLAAGSLTLDSTGASFTGSGDPPEHLCSAGCTLDATTGSSVASAGVGDGRGTWRAEGYSASSLSLSLPSTLRFVGSGNKLYRVDVLWTLASGPE
jgi:hypothetical protein